MPIRIITHIVFISVLLLIATASAILYAQTSQDKSDTAHQSHDAGKTENNHAEHTETTSATRDDAETDHEGHEASENAVHLTDAQLARLDLKIDKAKAGSASAIIQAPASIRFDADSVARVGPRLESKVIKVVKDLGDHVKAGETVAILDSVALGQAKARYLTTSARYQSALAEYQRDKKLAQKQITSEAELIKSRAAYIEARAEKNAVIEELRLYGMSEANIESIQAGSEQPFSRYLLSSPAAGVIQRRDLVPGQTVSPQETPIHIVNNERMWVMIEAAETDMPRLATGQKMKLTVRALPGRTFTGTTDWVSRELDEQSRTVRVRAIVPNEDGLLRAGMFGTARIHTESEQHLTLVPVDAIQTVDGQQVVFVPGDESGAFRAVPVRTGTEGDGQVEILSGLKPGERVVVAGAFDLMSALTASGRSAAHSH